MKKTTLARTIELLEARIAPATFTVTSTSTGGPGSLNEAIIAANALAGLDEIHFTVGTINLNSEITAISGPVVIDAHVTLIGYGLEINGGGSTVRGMTFMDTNGTPISITGGGGNVIAGNTITSNGFGGSGSGISVSSSNNLIGGPTSADGNVILGLGNHGVGLFGAGATGNTIQGNFIGTDKFGNDDVNEGNGIEISDASGNLVTGNTIAYGEGNGVHVGPDGGTKGGNRISANSIYGTVANFSGQGIDLGAGGSTNDAGDQDAGPNQLQNFPILTSAQNIVGGSVIAGRLNSTANQSFTIEFFEGKTFLGTTVVKTDAAGNAFFNRKMSNGFAMGTFITATATSQAGDTSEFSPSITAHGDPKAMSFTDSDGDLVTIQTSKGAFTAADFILTPLGAGRELTLLDLHGHDAFKGANITISAQKVAGGTGDGKVYVGTIDATGIDLGMVSVSGEIGQIDAGDAVLTTPAIRALTVGRLGYAGPYGFPPGPSNPIQSDLTGGLGGLVVKEYMGGVLLASGPIGPVTIGSLNGGNGGSEQAGLIKSDASITSVVVNQSIIGGGGLSGIVAGGKLGRVVVLDSIVGNPTNRVTISAFGKAGATGADAVAFAGLSVGNAVVDARFVAGFDLVSGAEVNPGAGIGPVTVAVAFNNSVVRATGAVATVTLGTLDGSAGGTRAGLIEGRTGVGAVTIKGGILGGADFTGILSGGKLGKVTVGDYLYGTESKPVTIAALGKPGAKTTADAVAIAGLAVAHSVLNLRILAGYDTSLAALNPDAGIGAVTVGGLWQTSSIAAGVQDTSIAGNLASAADGFGRNDTRIGSDTTPKILATIASITVKGTVTGSGSSASIHFGVTAEKILAASFGGVKQLLPAGPNNLLLDAANNDFRLVDFA